MRALRLAHLRDCAAPPPARAQASTPPASKGQRQNASIPDFRGRRVAGQKFFVGSFPGIYEDEWKRMTEGDEHVEEGRAMSVSCVFFPDGSDLSAKHATPCECKNLYGSGATKHPEFATWADEKAPWGCYWCVAGTVLSPHAPGRGWRMGVRARGPRRTGGIYVLAHT